MNNPKSTSELATHWPLLVVCLIGIGIGVSSLPFYTQGVFIASWIEEFGWSRAQASLGILGTTLVLAAISPVVGTAVDRYGPTKPIAFALTGLVLSYVLFAIFVQSVTTFIGLSMIMALLAGASSPLPYTRGVNAVFNRQRGIALGITLSGTGIAAAFGPRIISDIIQDHGWRTGYYALAGFTAVIGVVIVFVMSRLEGGKKPDLVDPETGLADFQNARKTPTYKLLMGAVFLIALGIGGLIVHFVPMLREIGLSPAKAATTAGIIGIAVILGRLVVGAAIDRVFAPYVAVIVISFCIAGTLALAIIGIPASKLAAFVIGFSIGAEVDLVGYLVARYFPMSAYGRIYGRQYAAFLLGTGISPTLLGIVRDWSGSYLASLYVAAGILGFAAFLFLKLPRFKKASK